MALSSTPSLEAAAGTERSASPKSGSRGCWAGCEVGLIGESPPTGPELGLGPVPSRSKERMVGTLALPVSRRERRERGGSGEAGPQMLKTRGERRGLAEGALVLPGRFRFRRLPAVSSWRTVST